MAVSKEWLKKWQEAKKNLKPLNNLEEYFITKEIAGKELAVIDIGPCSIPSGEFLVRDPLVYLADNSAKPYIQKIPSGVYRTEVCVVKATDDDCDRYAAVRLKFNDNTVSYYEEALVGDEKLNDIKEGDFFGFAVDAGLACICDKKLHKLFCDFDKKFYKENPDGNIYDDYFAALFKENYEKNPEYQREDGDWINWTIPNSDYHLPIFQSGFGDGVYPVYLAYDKDGNICQLIIEFIDIALAYGKADEE